MTSEKLWMMEQRVGIRRGALGCDCRLVAIAQLHRAEECGCWTARDDVVKDS